MQLNNLLNVNSIEITRSTFLFLALSKPVLVIKSLFDLFWNWIITLSCRRLQEVQEVT